MTKLVLSEGHITPDSPISVELIKAFPDGLPMIVITWGASAAAQMPCARRAATRTAGDHANPQTQRTR